MAIARRMKQGVTLSLSFEEALYVEDALYLVDPAEGQFGGEDGDPVDPVYDALITVNKTDTHPGMLARVSEPVLVARKSRLRELLDSIEQSCAQGERAMIELSWTMMNVNWRKAIEEIREALR